MSARSDLPTIEGENRDAWAAVKDHRLVIARCGTCGVAHHYPRPMCTSCWSTDVTLEDASGRGTLYTHSTVHLNDLPPFDEQLPYVAAVVDLDEGPRVVTRIVDCGADELRIGMPVEAVFVDLTDDTTVVHFRPLTSLTPKESS